MPNPATITRLCILGGVKGTWEEKERCPKTSPLTLTGITRALSNKGKKNFQEVEEEEERKVENPKQAMVLSIDRRKEERQKSISPRWNLSPDVREYNQDPSRSLRQQSSNSNIMDMLRRMKQGMQERDQQLKLQLQLRDEYMDVELKRRDQNLEDALKQRDEEWKKEIEERDAM